MKQLRDSERHALLEALRNRFAWAGDASRQPDGDPFWHHFVPVPRHLRAFDRDVVLVLGERGTGKSQLFQGVISRNGFSSLLPYMGNVRLPVGDLHWLTGYAGNTIGFPDYKGLRHLLDDGGLNRDQTAMDLWMAYLIRAIGDHLPPQAQKIMGGVLQPQGGDAISVLRAFASLHETPTLLLDNLDQELQRTGQTLIIGYDELDTLGGFDYTLMREMLRGLIGFWAHYHRRWQNIRGKVFIRTDLYRQFGSLLGPDLSKLAANRVEIEWTDDELRYLLCKRLLNTHSIFQRFAKGSGCGWEKDSQFGLVPKMGKIDDWRPFIEKIVSPFMGAGIKKGKTWYWIIDHIRDGRGKASPRPLLLMFEQAAGYEEQHALALPDQLLNHSALRAALDAVSLEEVNKAKELPWLEGLAERLKGLHVPIERDEVVKKIRDRWKQRWSQQTDQPPPADTADAFVELLIDWGIFSRRTNGKLDVPDLYRVGLHMLRKGGVKIG
jgi:hypothetical protein